ncbi:MAG: NAD-glutamate dehydrogenase [Gordonia sp. (in: high G+C Gram-positive bacteria)]|uniref:NAD-glutamate dehydrogenase domain-containing protein n=1 Tax=Gordonia sp. (in: high G+C Gram-positive bacteria) TaxID=84139 RepID=UPI0039E2E038
MTRKLLDEALVPYTRDGGDRDQLSRHLAVGKDREPSGTRVGVDRRPDGTIEVFVVAANVPLLVESVLAVIADAGLTVEGINHPIMRAVRDGRGRLTGFGGDDAVDESWICVHTFASASCDPAGLATDVRRAVATLDAVTADGDAMRDALRARAGSAGGDDAEYDALIEWFAEAANFHLVGYATSDGGPGLGVWSGDDTVRLQPVAAPGRPVIDRAYLETDVLRTRYPLVLRFADGSVEHQFVGTLTPTGTYQSVQEIPLVRTKVAGVLKALGVSADSFNGLAAIDILQTYPLVGLFASPVSSLTRRVSELLAANVEHTVRLFLRLCADGHTASVMAFVPRDRYDSTVRNRVIDSVTTALDGADPQFATRITEAPLAQLQVTVRLRRTPDPAGFEFGSDLHTGLQASVIDAVRSWDDDVRDLTATDSSVAGLLPAVSDRYREERDPAGAARDLPIVAGLAADGLHITVAEGEPWTLTLYLAGRDAALTDVLPMLGSLGLTVLDERPFRVDRADGVGVRIYEFAVRPAPGVEVADGDDLTGRLADGLRRMWLAEVDVDDLNRLILGAGATAREVAMLRTYVRYLGQCEAIGSVTHAAEVLGEHADVTRALIRVFTTSFDPALDDTARPRLTAAATDHLSEALSGVLSLDADRVLSALAAAVEATLRTNYYRADDPACRALDGEFSPVLAVKIATDRLTVAPEPRPLFEIFVHSPRVEGVHLRFGAVARGGCRWSDRREDFRTEILGLAKAQAVKNAVIVPAGAKGGFVVRRPPVATGDAAARQAAQREEGVACYRAFVAALIALTDDLHPDTGDVVPPAAVVRRDGDDPYLVMAADKGTASFSDIANGVAAHYGFWLGDAFASGGSIGYDHKAMGITARGAWEAVKRHFAELGTDIQRDEFTVVGIGDMSGDVFGNGMLLSPCTRLVAAFDHRHVFVDPDPDASSSFDERARLFALPRSSWADYRRDLISDCGGVWSREVKSIPVSPEMRACLGMPADVVELSPPDLIRAILRAPVDLLFNGGIGTYVKASTESDQQVGDKANDAVRVDGRDLRVRVVGEGGNLGVTALGRVEADLAGIRINTNAMDNSAGVDCSDHEVNIKILLDAQISAGALDAGDRTALLESMTDEVAELVLADNIAQNAELGAARARADHDVDLHGRLLTRLADRGVELALDALPTADELRDRADSTGRGLTSPELATVMAHVKLLTKSDLLATGLLANEYFDPMVVDYFPQPLRDRFADGMTALRLRPEIVATVLVNRIVDDAGTTHLFRTTESASAGTEDAVRATMAADGAFGLSALIERIRDTSVPVATVDAMTITVRGLYAGASAWFLHNRPQPLAVAAEVRRYRTARELGDSIDSWARPRVAGQMAATADGLRARGVPTDLAQTLARVPHEVPLLDIVDIAEITERDPLQVGDLTFAVLEHFRIDELLTAVDDLDTAGHWPRQARTLLRGDLYDLTRALTLAILQASMPGETAVEMIADWVSSRGVALKRAEELLDEVAGDGEPDLAALTVAVGALRRVVL